MTKRLTNAELRKRVDELEKDPEERDHEVYLARKAAAQAETRVESLVNQVKDLRESLEASEERVMELERQIASYDADIARIRAEAVLGMCRVMLANPEAS